MSRGCHNDSPRPSSALPNCNKYGPSLFPLTMQISLYHFHNPAIPLTPNPKILPPSPRAQCSCHRVYLSNFSYHWILTETFNNPETILHGQRLIHTVYNVQLDNNSITVVITLQKLLDKWKVAQALIVMLLVLSPTLGWLVGHLSDSAEAGIAVSAGVFMVASFVQGLTAWMVG